MNNHPSYLTRHQARKIDDRALDEFEIPGAILMENAGRGCVDVLCSLGIRGPVVICCGKGNNAGDGFVMARHLDLRGYRVKVLAWCEPPTLRGDASLNYRILEHSEIPIVSCRDVDSGSTLRPHFESADWIVDALLGTGAEGPPRPPFAGVIQLLNELPARKLAVDLPSGLDVDMGTPSPTTFRAHHTCTFVAPKQGFSNPLSHSFLGQVHVVDIGAPRALVSQFVR